MANSELVLGMPPIKTIELPCEKLDAYVERLKAKGIEVSPILNHDNSRMGVSAEVTPAS